MKNIIKKIETKSKVKFIQNSFDTLDINNKEELTRLLELIDCKPPYKIVAADITFEINFYSEEDLVKIGFDIWNNPQKYFECEDSYYDFLKFLWIDSTDLKYNDIRFTELFCTESIFEDLDDIKKLKRHIKRYL